MTDAMLIRNKEVTEDLEELEKLSTEAALAYETREENFKEYQTKFMQIMEPFDLALQMANQRLHEARQKYANSNYKKMQTKEIIGKTYVDLFLPTDEM